MVRELQRRRLAYETAKRLLDLVGSLLGLLLLSPVMVFLALLVRLDSKGPVLFRQVRVGRGGREFVMYKFRSMTYPNDDAVHEEYYRRLVAGEAQARLNEAGEPVYLLDDPRLTRVGRLLRRTSLDELPNLINVLGGSMSLVGPRPPIPYEVSHYDQLARRRLEVKPGMTGLAQVRGRGSLSFREIIEADIEYVDRRSLWLDLSILIKTVPAVLLRRGV